ncbi:ribosome maturation factor RimP [Deinococcus antarcticus]|uniref:Ribosome maturation factor RimP n=1 Tax=Deinococcus antarcticus TaxID=1298767 RepID=A0ABV8A4W4_9DEIO
MNNNADNNSALVTLAQQAVQPLGFEVLEVQQQKQGGEHIVLIRIDRLDEQPVTMDDLTKASRAADTLFDEADPIPGEYRLEFESPGSKRPLTRARHFERMLGLKARVKSATQTFTAPIKAVNGDDVTFTVGGEDITVKASEVQANLAEFPDRHR